MKVTTEMLNDNTQRVTTQVSHPNTSTRHRFVKFAEQDLVERNNLYRLLEIPSMFNSRWNDQIAIRTPEAAVETVDLKSASVSVLDEVVDASNNERLSKLLSLGNPDLSFMETYSDTAVQLKSASVTDITTFNQTHPGLSHKNPAIKNMIAKEEAEQSNDKLSRLLEIPQMFMNK